MTKVQPAVVPEVTLEKLRPPTQSGIRSREPPPGLPLSLTFDPLRVGVKGVPVTAVKIPVIGNGELVLADRPGWGIEVNEKAVRKHAPVNSF